MVSAVEKVTNNLTVTDTYNECFVQISINYFYQCIEISFGSTFHTNFLIKNQEVHVTFSMDLAEDEIIFDSARIINILKFACDYADECDRHFVLNHLDWLFKAKYVQLESAIRPLLTTHDDNAGNILYNLTPSVLESLR
jgi:hypothetical protein